MFTECSDPSRGTATLFGGAVVPLAIANLFTCYSPEMIQSHRTSGRSKLCYFPCRKGLFGQIGAGAPSSGCRNDRDLLN
jgi:hypothetical protein